MEDAPTSSASSFPASFGLTAERLACMIQEKTNDLLMVDLRSFMSFNQCHLQSSINVCIPSSLLKRKTFSLSSVESAIGCDKSREKFKKRHGSDIIVYDSDCDKAKKTGPLITLLQKLKDESLVTGIFFLHGGFQSFAQKFPQFCCSKDSLSSTSPSSSPFSSLSSMLRPLPLLTPPLQTPNPDVSDKEPVEIFDFLFVGGQDVSSNLETLKKYDLTYILNAAKEVPDDHTDEPSLKYLRLDLLDCATQDIDFQLFETAFNFIDEARRNGKKILVHCKAGQSRSATIVISYIIRTERWSLHQAYKFVQGKRPAVSPNLGFIAQLIRFETSVLGTATPIQQLISSSPCPMPNLPPPSSSLFGSSKAAPSSSASSPSPPPPVVDSPPSSTPSDSPSSSPGNSPPLEGPHSLLTFDRNHPSLEPIGCN